jgi:hypothetical protein
MNIPNHAASIMKFICLPLLLLVVCCQKQEYKKHYIVVEKDGHTQKLKEFSPLRLREETSSPITIYCYYLDERGEKVKDGEECIYNSFGTVSNVYRDGKIIESIATGLVP